MSPFGLKFESVEEAQEFLTGLRAHGLNNIAGVDECGRGCLAGPVVSACVLLDLDHGIEGIADSKKISKKKRERLSLEIKEKSSFGVGIKTCKEVDTYNVRVCSNQAAAEAAMRCLYGGAPIEFLLCDGGLILDSMVPFPTQAAIKGDYWFECIGAASIIAKVYRDALMSAYAACWPEYGFDRHQGYGTALHRAAIVEHGLSPIHRRTYGICKTMPSRKEVIDNGC